MKPKLTLALTLLLTTIVGAADDDGHTGRSGARRCAAKAKRPV